MTSGEFAIGLSGCSGNDVIEFRHTMTPGEHEETHRCERCDRETPHVVEYISDNNQPHYVCWDCVARQEKRFNQKPGWRRHHRTRRYEQLAPPPAPQGLPEPPKVS